MITAGIDAGSRAIKAIVWDADRRAVLGRARMDQGVRQRELAAACLSAALAEAGVEAGAVDAAVATGYARNLVEAAGETVTEITCHGRGVATLRPDARTVVEIGGQDSKLLRLDAGGRVRDFAMNDRCAAGTGRFLEMVAQRLETPLDRLGELARASETPATISSMCVVFAESEIIGLLAEGAAPADVVAGVQQAIAHRVAALAGGRVEAPVALTGGAGRVGGMVDALAGALGAPVELCDQADYTGALGAAIVAAERSASKGAP
jgi:predicted CoA-substrate-specific enzyme activase